MKTMQQGFTLIELMIVVAIIGILAAVALPQYQTYVAKSQMSRAVAESGALKTAIEDCVNNGKLTVGKASANNCDTQATGSSILTGDSQGDIAIDTATTGVPQAALKADGSGTIIATFGHSAAAALLNKTVTWTRDLNGQWTCKTNADQKYATAACPNGS